VSDTEYEHHLLRRAFDGVDTLNVTVVAATATEVPLSSYPPDNGIWRAVDNGDGTIRIIYV
jgi:hypothetical protein